MRRFARLAAVVALLSGLMGTSVAPANAAEPTDVVSWGAFHGYDVRTPDIGPTGVVAIVPTGDGGILALKGDGTVVAAWGATNPPAGLTGVTKIATGGAGYINLALKADGTVVGWSYPHSSAPAVPAGLTGVVDIAVGRTFAVALKSDGTVVAWGDNSKGQTNVPAALTGVTAIATGANLDYALAIKSNGAVVAWGTSAPAVPGGLTGVVSVAPGDGYVLALKSDGTVTAWGSDATGTAVPGGLSGVASVVAATNGSGTGQGFAVKSDGTVVEWGGGDYCDAGIVPGGLSNVVSLVTDGIMAAAIKSDGTVTQWGDTCSFWEYGVPGYPGTVAAALDGNYGYALMADGKVFRSGGASINYSQPSNLQGATLIDAGAGHELVTMGSGAIVPWGDDRWGQIDIEPSSLTGVTQVSAGGTLSFGRKSDGTVVFLEDLYYPPGMTNPYLPPAGLSGVMDIDAGGGYGSSYVLARKSDGTVVAWGDADGGQTTVPASLSSVTAVSAGGDCALALRSDNTVVGWGDYCPAVPTGLTGVTAVSAGGDFNLALKSDHTVVAWGSNDHGQATVPGGLTTVTAIAAGYDFALALKSDGTVVAWGNDDQGQIDIPAGLGNDQHHRRRRLRLGNLQRPACGGVCHRVWHRVAPVRQRDERVHGQRTRRLRQPGIWVPRHDPFHLERWVGDSSHRLHLLRRGPRHARVHRHPGDGRDTVCDCHRHGHGLTYRNAERDRCHGSSRARRPDGCLGDSVGRFGSGELDSTRLDRRQAGYWLHRDIDARRSYVHNLGHQLSRDRAHRGKYLLLHRHGNQHRRHWDRVGTLEHGSPRRPRGCTVCRRLPELHQLWHSP
jgi:alpha-tubulin suppressor-like RCC1 family protein